MPTTTGRYAIGDLATLGGVSRRTVRFYVQERLIPPPLGLGRGNHYTDAHLQQLLRVKAMQEAGWALDDIRRELARTRPSRAADRQPEDMPLPRTLWRRMTLAPGVELHVASSIPVPSPSRLRELAEWCRLHLAAPPRGNSEENRDE